MHLRALELAGSVNTEASMESEKASFGGPDWQEPAGVPKCFMVTADTSQCNNNKEKGTQVKPER